MCPLKKFSHQFNLSFIIPKGFSKTYTGYERAKENKLKKKKVTSLTKQITKPPKLIDYFPYLRCRRQETRD
jgi:hypothetical protein